jgi:16S rRNA (cytosine1402-N4)-methyltransferase
MTYGLPEEGKTAADVVNSLPESELSDIIFTLGEERFARQIARGIVEARGRRRILTTKDLSEVIEQSTPAWYHHRRINPATKTFQALRMYVNDELGSLRDALSTALARLSEGGRVAVITFHSIEDRIVKNMLRDAAYEGQGILITRKPIVPSLAECARNPRARSAKLRVFERATETV